MLRIHHNSKNDIKNQVYLSDGQLSDQLKFASSQLPTAISIPLNNLYKMLSKQ